MNILLKALLLVSQKRNWQWSGGVSGLASIMSYVDVIGIKITEDKVVNAVVIFTTGFIAVFLLLYIYYIIRLSWIWVHDTFVESIWGMTIKELGQIYADIHQIERNDNYKDEDIAMLLGTFCASVKTIFDRKTNSSCCVSIKVPIQNPKTTPLETLEVKNIARDQDHISARDTQEYKQTKHNIVGNTAYSRIISSLMAGVNVQRHYINNNVDSINKNNYFTTSLGKDRPAIPYKSELVVPIIPQKYKCLNDIKFCGFLCIDSDKAGSFDENRYDIPLAIGLADGLYSLMCKLVKS